MGFIFSSSVSLEPSTETEKGRTFMLSSSSFFNSGAIAMLSMHIAFVEAEWYFEAMGESGKTALIVGDR